MKKLIILLVSLLPAVIFAQETKISKKEVPAAVIKAFKETYPKAVIKGTNKENKKGMLYYEIESKDGKTSRDVLYTPAGVVSEVEEIITMKGLPEPVVNAIKKQFPKGKIKSIEKNIQGDVTQYEVLMQNGKKKSEVIFSTDGNIVNNQ